MPTVIQALRFLSSSGLDRVLAVVGLLAVYLLLDWASYLYPFRGFNITPWNPLAGLSVFVLLRWGIGFAPVILVGRVAGDLLIRHGTVSLPTVLVGASVIVLGYSLAAHLLRRQGCTDLSEPRLKDVTALVLVAALVTAPMALSYVTLLAAAEAIAWENLYDAGLRRFIGDFIGIVTLLPCLLILAQRHDRGRPLASPGLVNLAQAAAVVGVVFLIFGVPAIDEYKFFYLLFLPMIWIAMQGGLEGAAFGVLGTQLTLIVVIRTLGEHSGAGVTVIQVLMTALAVTGIMLGTVVSERRTAETRLAEKQAELGHVSRRSVSGELASVMAHELNQPLTAIINYSRVCQMLMDNGGDPGLLRETLAKTIQQAGRAGEIIRRLRDFLGRGDSMPAHLPAADLLEEAAELIQPTLRSARVELDWRVDPNLPTVFADRVQIQQVIHNLMRNAVEAMAAARPARRRLALSAWAEEDSGAVVVRVGDNGPGLEPEVAGRIFDPFVTTKPTGMGLGLSISKSIIEAHGGRLWHEPVPEGGAAFYFTLPPASTGETDDDA